MTVGAHDDDGLNDSPRAKTALSDRGMYESNLKLN